LRNPISQQFLNCHSTGGKDPKANRWIDVAARNLADAISHGHNAETEGKCNRELVNGRRTRGHSTNHNRSASDENQGECADELGDSLLHNQPPKITSPQFYND
jgi:hypothetical protein